jgi:hypothetical protein
MILPFATASSSVVSSIWFWSKLYSEIDGFE